MATRLMTDGEISDRKAPLERRLAEITDAMRQHEHDRRRMMFRRAEHFDLAGRLALSDRNGMQEEVVRGFIAMSNVDSQKAASCESRLAALMEERGRLTQELYRLRGYDRANPKRFVPPTIEVAEVPNPESTRLTAAPAGVVVDGKPAARKTMMAGSKMLLSDFLTEMRGR
jgi:hypothetical protein